MGWPWAHEKAKPKSLIELKNGTYNLPNNKIFDLENYDKTDVFSLELFNLAILYIHWLYLHCEILPDLHILSLQHMWRVKHILS